MHQGSFSSWSRVGRQVIIRSLGRFLSSPGCVLKNRWSSYWTPNLLQMSRSALCTVVSAINVWMFVWIIECVKCCELLWVFSRLEKFYRIVRPFTCTFFFFLLLLWLILQPSCQYNVFAVISHDFNTVTHKNQFKVKVFTLIYCSLVAMIMNNCHE